MPPGAGPAPRHTEIVTDQPVPQRIGDAERDRAVECLQEHMAQGRLTQDEFDERITAALAAKVQADLDPLFVDLPEPRPSRPQPATPPPAPTWAATPAVRPNAVPAAPGRGYEAVLATIAAVAWPATLIILFATGAWHLWWLIFIPMFVTGGFGRYRQGRRR